MKTLAAILLSVGIMLIANTNSQALTFDFDGLADSIADGVDLDQLFLDGDAILANLDERIDRVSIMQGDWGHDGRFFSMRGYQADDLVLEYAILTRPTGLAVEPIAPVGLHIDNVDLDIPGLDWNRPTPHDEPVPTPEPATLLLLGSGLLGVGWTTRKAKKRLS